MEFVIESVVIGRIDVVKIDEMELIQYHIVKNNLGGTCSVISEWFV